MARNAAVIGASGGIGGAVAAALLAHGDRVHALGRSAPRVAGALAHPAIDLLDEASVAAAARSVATDAPLDLVLVATGILHGPGLAPEKTIRSIDPAAIATLMAVNAIGPAIVAKHFVPLLRRPGRAVFAALSARVGSIADNRLGGWYGYRASKAALNQIMRTLAIEVGRTNPDAIVLALHPGTVGTALSRPFRAADAEGVVPPEAAARNLITVLDAAIPAQSGSLLAWDGEIVPP